MTTGASSPPFYFVLRTSFSLLIAPSTYVLMLTPARTVQIVDSMKYTHIGLSTLSKLLYFAGLVSEEGPMLIYDQMVMRALHYHGFVEYGDWPAYSGVAQRMTYSKFILMTTEAAARIECEPEVIEYALFKEGQRLGRRLQLPAVDELTEELAATGVEVESVVDEPVEELPTFGGQSTFTAQFHADGDVTLYYGSVGMRRVSRAVLETIARHFRGTAIPLTAMAGPSLNGWLMSNFSKTRLASYVGPVLERLGYAVREGETMRFPCEVAK